MALALFVLALSSGATRAGAQESRTEEIARQQAEKAGDLRPYEPPTAERLIVGVKERFLEQPSGLFPYFQSVHGGGGLTLGGGYRRFYGDRSLWEVKGLYSLKDYKLIEVATTSPGHARGRLALGARAGWRDATQVGYYGLGIDSQPDDESNFRFLQTYLGATATFRPRGWLVLAGAVTYEDFSTRAGEGRSPSIEALHTPATTPGLGANPVYLHSEATAGIDWRGSPGYSRTGGYYGVTFHDYSDLDGTFRFSRLDADAIQHVPILRETWVISLRGQVQTTLDDEDQVPYFLMPSLASGSTLRGYRSWRFRDRHGILVSAEWRWIPNRLGLDMALFFDAGKVTRQRRGLGLSGLRRNWGIGARFHGPTATPLRIELARGDEGWNLVFAGTAAF